MFAGIPPCPPRTFDARNPESVERARVELSMWIIQLLHHHPIYTSHVFIDFVSAEANVRPFCMSTLARQRASRSRVSSLHVLQIPPPGLQQNTTAVQAPGGRNNIGELDVSIPLAAIRQPQCTAALGAALLCSHANDDFVCHAINDAIDRWTRCLTRLPTTMRMHTKSSATMT